MIRKMKFEPGIMNKTYWKRWEQRYLSPCLWLVESQPRGWAREGNPASDVRLCRICHSESDGLGGHKPAVLGFGDAGLLPLASK